jgi:hypothetical protein
MQSQAESSEDRGSNCCGGLQYSKHIDSVEAVRACEVPAVSSLPQVLAPALADDCVSWATHRTVDTAFWYAWAPLLLTPGAAVASSRQGHVASELDVTPGNERFRAFRS